MARAIRMKAGFVVAEVRSLLSAAAYDLGIDGNGSGEGSGMPCALLQMAKSLLTSAETQSPSIFWRALCTSSGLIYSSVSLGCCLLN